MAGLAGYRRALAHHAQPQSLSLGAVGSARLTELDVLPSPPVVRTPNTPETRTVGLYLTGANALDRFGGGGGEPGLNDDLAAVRNLVGYASSCGASLVFCLNGLPTARSASPFTARWPKTRPDRIGSSSCSDCWNERAAAPGSSSICKTRMRLPGLPPPDSALALQTGLVRVDRQGLADGPAYHPLHPEVRKAMKRRVEGALQRRGDGSALTGLLIQLGRGPTLLGTPDTGMDDVTYSRFVQETFGPETVEGLPALTTTDPNRFTARARYLAGVGRMPWLTWRSRAIAALYAELADAARAASPAPCSRWRRPACMAERQAPRPDASIWPVWLRVRHGGASGSTWKPGPPAPVLPSSCVELSFPPTHSPATWPPAPTWTPRLRPCATAGSS